MGFEQLKLENQLCFPLYACAKEVVRKYKPYLDEIGLTYTQYIAMLVMWEYGSMNVKSLGQRLYLDSGTLTPLLKKLENAGLITRSRSHADERNLIVALTPRGQTLEDRAKDIPHKMSACINLAPDEAAALYGLLHKVLNSFEQ